VQAEHGWRALKVETSFELASAVGVLAALSGPIAAAGIAIFTWATEPNRVSGTHRVTGSQSADQKASCVRSNRCLARPSCVSSFN
jgi:hypothetical protein